MISVYSIKPQFQRVLTPILGLLHRAKVTANQITLWACVLSLVIGILFWFAGDVGTWLYLCLPVGLLIRMALNALDGMMARCYNQITRKGELLNEVGDVVSDTIIYFPLLKYHPESLYFIVAFIALSIINEYAGVMGKVLSAERRYDGPMGKSDRAFVLSLYGVVCLFGINLSGYSVYIFGVIDLLLVLSTWIRIKKTLKVTRNSQTPE